MASNKSTYTPRQVARLKVALRKRNGEGRRIHVTLEDGEWVVFIEDAKKAIGSYPLRASAITRARELQKRRGTRLFVHEQDGTIEVMEPAVK